MRVLATALVALVPPSVHPWPIGPPPRYLPGAATAAVRAGESVGDLRCAKAGPSFRIHLELFAGRKVIVVPAGIGVAAPLRQDGSAVVPGGCVYPVRTLAPGGVVEVARGSGATLGDVFRVWGRALGRTQLLSFRSSSPVRAYVGGRLVRGPVGAIPLTHHAEIVLELGPYVAPHSFFLFPGGGS
jgi:hypothetical protein